MVVEHKHRFHKIATARYMKDMDINPVIFDICVCACGASRWRDKSDKRYRTWQENSYRMHDFEVFISYARKGRYRGT